MESKVSLVPVERIGNLIIIVREQKIILDRDLAALYEVSTGNLNKAVNRNISRFPADFMVQLTAGELHSLIFHFGTSSWGGTRKPPRAFTKQEVAMLSSVLRGKRAGRVNIEIMRAFVRLRRMLQANTVLARQLKDLEKKYDSQFKMVFDAIRQLMTPPARKPHKIGFKVQDSEKSNKN
jgi:hypothetical protein